MEKKNTILKKIMDMTNFSGVVCYFSPEKRIDNTPECMHLINITDMR